jgi:hypothetical protein
MSFTWRGEHRREEGAVATTQNMLERWVKIEERKNALIEKAEGFFEARKRAGKKVVPIAHSQWQGLLRLALSTTSVKEIHLFIRYQEGRAQQGEGWRSGDFGKDLRTALAEVEKDAGDDQALSMELVRLFLGYLMREARWRESAEER